MLVKAADVILEATKINKYSGINSLALIYSVKNATIEPKKPTTIL